MVPTVQLRSLKVLSRPYKLKFIDISYLPAVPPSVSVSLGLFLSFFINQRHTCDILHLRSIDSPKLTQLVLIAEDLNPIRLTLERLLISN